MAKAPKEPKPKKKKEPKLEDFLRLYFSSLTARSACFVYFNVLDQPNTIVVSNGDYNLLTSYVPVTLCMHILEFKEASLYQQFVQLLDLPTTEPYVINIAKVLAVMNKNKGKGLKFQYDQEYQLYVTPGDDQRDLKELRQEAMLDIAPPVSLDDEDEDDESEEPLAVRQFCPVFEAALVSGSRVTNLHALLILQNTLATILRVDPAFLAEHPHQRHIIEQAQYIHSNVYAALPDMTQFLDAQGQTLFSASDPACRVLLIDGSDTVSMKEFARKKITASPELIIWVENQTLKHISRFEDEEVRITSARPFSVTIPIGHLRRRQ